MSDYTINHGGLLRCCLAEIETHESYNGGRHLTCRWCGAKLERDEQRVWRWVREG